MSSKKNGSAGKKNRKAVIITAIILAIAVIGGGVYYFTGTDAAKLRKAGYTQEQIKRLQSVFTKDQLKTLEQNSAQPDIFEIASDARYQPDSLEGYLKGLAEGKDPSTLLDDYDPWVIGLRASEGYREDFLDNYLRVYPSGDPANAAWAVEYINRSYDLIDVPGYRVELAQQYETYYQSNKLLSYEEIVRQVNLIEKYKEQTYFIESNLERYEAYSAANPDKDTEEVVRCVNAGIDRPFYTDIEPADMSKGYLVLVNKYYYVEKDYEPELESLTGYGYGYLETEAAKHFREMVDAARADGISLRSVSPFRTWNTQSGFYWGYVNSAGQAKADTYSARPGHSEHETGLAVDINTADIADHFENTKEYEWLINNCYKYGFILRYLEGKQYLTGYVYEPWHYRYVGTDYAEKIMSSGLTFEEYYAYYINNPDKQ